MKLTLFAMVSILATQPGGCGHSTDSQQERATEAMVAQANREVGMPEIVNWAERRNAKTILELRDRELSATWIMLRDPRTGDVKPVYVEPEIIVSPFPLKSDDNYLPGR